MYYIVWNEKRTEGFVTKDKQLAYEVRKGADTNCFYEDGTPSIVGQQFCHTYGEENCVMYEGRIAREDQYHFVTCFLF